MGKKYTEGNHLEDKLEAEEYFKQTKFEFAEIGRSKKTKKNSTEYIFRNFMPLKDLDKDLSGIEKLGLEVNDYSD